MRESSSWAVKGAKRESHSAEDRRGSGRGLRKEEIEEGKETGAAQREE
jgi:hypothetical protein